MYVKNHCMEQRQKKIPQISNVLKLNFCEKMLDFSGKDVPWENAEKKKIQSTCQPKDIHKNNTGSKEMRKYVRM